MKTSKRFLSIVLMLAMLVSMFTVMAFADDTPKSVTVDLRIDNADGGTNGKVIYTGNKQEITENTTFTASVDGEFVAKPAEGYTASWETDDKNVSITGDRVSLAGAAENITLKVTFVKQSSEKPTEPEKPTKPEPENLNVFISIVGGKYGTVKNGDAAVESPSVITLESSDEVTLTAVPDSDCTVSWELKYVDKTVTSKRNTFKLTGEKKGNASLTITFTSNTQPEPTTERELTVSIGSNGQLTRAGAEVADQRTYDLNENDTFTFTAYAKEGYKVQWKIDNGSTTTSTGRTAEITVPYSSLKASGSTLYVSFVRESTSGRTLTLDITRKSYGDVEWKWDDGKYYKDAADGIKWTLEDGEEIDFFLDPDSGYEVYWQLDSSRKYYSESFSIGYDNLSKNGSTLYVVFAKKGSSTDNSHTLTIDITGAKHGTVKRGTTKVLDGDTISLEKNETRTFKATPDKGYVAVWTFQGESYVGNSYTVKMGSKNATLYVEFMDEDDYRLTKLPFRDVSEKDWFYDDVAYVYRNGYMEGVSSTKFAPNQNTTRAQIVTILWRLTGEPRATKSNKFNDVSSSAYYDKAVSWAVEAGVVNGFDAKTFKPNDYVTREQLAAILYRYAEYMNLSTRGASNLTKYDDYYQIGTWARDAMAWANYHGLINGVSYTRIDPKGCATRAQVAAILHRFAVEFGNY